MIATIVVLALLYPRFGFTRRSVRADLKADRERILQTLHTSGYSLVAESEGTMIFRASSPLKRALLLWEDRIAVTADGESITLDGIRKGSRAGGVPPEVFPRAVGKPPESGSGHTPQATFRVIRRQATEKHEKDNEIRPLRTDRRRDAGSRRERSRPHRSPISRSGATYRFCSTCSAT